MRQRTWVTKSGCRIAQTFALLSMLFSAGGSFALPVVTPTTLPPGAQYRLAFMSAATNPATSTEIADYDAFVLSEAFKEPALRPFSWQVIGSTTTVDARDHTGTSPLAPVAIPIYLLNDTKLVDDYADLWDGSIDRAFNITQHGMTRLNPGEVSILTGTTRTGTADPLFPFGSANGSVAIGRNESTGWGWIDSFSSRATGALPMYALSEVLTVPAPEPKGLVLCIFALVSLGLRLLGTPPGRRVNTGSAPDRG